LLINLFNLDFGAPTTPLYPEVLQTKECTPTFFFFSVVFTFGFAVESIKELGGTSIRGD
jgi:hypothetical protein